MGNFTDDLFSAAKKPGNVPIGSTRYSMAEVSFFLKQTPKELLGGVVAGFIQQMEKAGQYGQAKEMHANPQPFYGNPQCLGPADREAGGPAGRTGRRPGRRRLSRGDASAARLPGVWEGRRRHG